MSVCEIPTETEHALEGESASTRPENEARNTPRTRAECECFTEVVLRATWPEVGVTGHELLELGRARGPILSEQELDAVEEAKAADRIPEDKWASR
jgi:hypothetical protein